MTNKTPEYVIACTNTKSKDGFFLALDNAFLIF